MGIFTCIDQNCTKFNSFVNKATEKFKLKMTNLNISSLLSVQRILIINIVFDLSKLCDSNFVVSFFRLLYVQYQ